MQIALNLEVIGGQNRSRNTKTIGFQNQYFSSSWNHCIVPPPTAMLANGHTMVSAWCLYMKHNDSSHWSISVTHVQYLNYTLSQQSLAEYLTYNFGFLRAMNASNKLRTITPNKLLPDMCLLNQCQMIRVFETDLKKCLLGICALLEILWTAIYKIHWYTFYFKLMWIIIWS